MDWLDLFDLASFDWRYIVWGIVLIAGAALALTSEGGLQMVGIGLAVVGGVGLLITYLKKNVE
jgi:hypothetical protein